MPSAAMFASRRSRPAPKERRRKNARQEARRYYGLHMSPGVCEYEQKNGTDRIFIDGDAIRRMNPTFDAKPLYALHQDTRLNTLHEDADGYVVKSFYNPADGNVWCEFIAATDEAHEAIRQGWKLSNSYLITDSAGGGTWHNVAYDEQVLDGIFEHLALVPNPRYEESMILTPEQFRAYNERKERELRTLQNSKKEQKMPFSLFKKQKVTNARQLSDALVKLDDGTTVPFKRMLRAVAEEQARDDRRRNSRGARRRNADDAGGIGDQEVTVGDQVMTVRQLIAMYEELKGMREPQNADDSDDDEDEDKRRKTNARRRRSARDEDDGDDQVVISARAIRSNGRDEGDEEEDDELDPPARGRRNSRRDDPGPEGEDDDLQLAGDEDEGDDEPAPKPRRANSRRDAAHNAQDPADVVDGGDDDAPEDDEVDPVEPRRNSAARRGGDRAPAKGKGKRSNQGDGRLVRLSPHELQMLRESRELHARNLRNAREEGFPNDGDDQVLDTSADQIQRGMERYGAATVPGQVPQKH